MKTDYTINKFILLVLSLILVCLVLLVIRAYQKPLPAIEQAAIPDANTIVFEEAVPVRPIKPNARPTNTLRAPVPNQPGTPPPTVPEEPPSPVVVSETRPVVVNFNGYPNARTNRHQARPANLIPPHQTSLYGMVNLVGTPKPEIPIDMGATCGSLNANKVTTRHFVVSPEGGLANVLVYLKAHNSPWKFDYYSSGPPPLLDQVGCMFEPYVMGVVTGLKFQIRNSDPTLHNIHATPKLNREFNIGQPLQGQVTERSFPKPEVFVRIKCDVHPWMFAYIGVVSHPFFAVTDTNGVFQLPSGFPPGDYTISAMHVKAGEITQEINISEGETKALHFTFSVDPAVHSQARVASGDTPQEAALAR